MHVNKHELRQFGNERFSPKLRKPQPDPMLEVISKPFFSSFPLIISGKNQLNLTYIREEDKSKKAKEKSTFHNKNRQNILVISQVRSQDVFFDHHNNHNFMTCH